MPYDPATHHRRSIRLHEWDYASPGAYFVTIVDGPLFRDISGSATTTNTSSATAGSCELAAATSVTTHAAGGRIGNSLDDR